MDKRLWERLNTLLGELEDARLLALSLSSQYWDRRSLDGVSHPSEDELKSVSDTLVDLRNTVAGIARREVAE